MTTRRPWGVEAISAIYHADVQAGLPDGRWVAAVAEPYATNPIERIRAAWWVITGRAVAFVWPKPGDLEAVFKRERDATQPMPGRPFEQAR